MSCDHLWIVIASNYRAITGQIRLATVGVLQRKAVRCGEKSYLPKFGLLTQISHPQRDLPLSIHLG